MAYMPPGSITFSSMFAHDWVGCGAAASTDVILEKSCIWNYVHNKGVYQCATDAMIPAMGVTGHPINYPFSYSLNEELSSDYTSQPCGETWLKGVKLDTETGGRTGKVLLILHEGRKNPKIANSGINDGYFGWRSSFNDLPSQVHYSGTTCAYADTHVKWLSYDQLMVDSDQATATNPYNNIDNNVHSQWLNNDTISYLRSHGYL